MHLKLQIMQQEQELSWWKLLALLTYLFVLHKERLDNAMANYDLHTMKKIQIINKLEGLLHLS